MEKKPEAPAGLEQNPLIPQKKSPSFTSAPGSPVFSQSVPKS